MPIPPLVIAALGAAQLGSSIYGAVSGSNAADRASRRQADAIQKGIDLQKEIYNQTRNDYLPYVGAGKEGLEKYQQLLGSWQAPTLDYTQKDFDFNTYNDPGAQYRMDQAMKAINSSAAAKGGMGGGVLRNLQEESQKMASQEYANSYDRYLKESQMKYGQASDKYNRDYQASMVPLTGYSDIAKLGASTAANLGRVGDQYSTNVGNMYAGQGNAFAQGIMGGNNAVTSQLGNLVNQGVNLAGLYYSKEVPGLNTTTKQGTVQ